MTDLVCRYCSPGSSSSLSRFHRQSLERANSSTCSLCRLIASAVLSFCSNRALSTPKAVDCWYPNTGDITFSVKDRQISLQLCCSDSSQALPSGFDWCHASRPSGDTGSEAAMTWARERLTECINEHDLCRGPKSPLPSRLLEIEALVPATQSATSHGPLSVKLVETKSLQGDYACLSHCWGASGPLKTTKSKYTQYLSSIPWDELPKSFQQAASFAHQLKIRYLWIDSLCIIQDDPDDLKHEIAQMCSIYEGSLVTLAITKSRMSSEGCFSTLPPEHARYTVPTSGDSKWPSVLVREAFDHAYSVHGYENVLPEKAPLLSRGWVLQERILSRRILHFTHEELAFECLTSRSCECGRDTHDLPGFKAAMSQAVQTDSRDALYSKWRSLVERYTTMNLTFESDRLPAISGLATMFERRLQDGYYHGIWAGNLLPGLNWLSIAPARRVEPSAPSWSWASASSAVRHPYPGKWAGESTKVPCDASIVDIKTVPELHPFTSASHFLRLVAPSVRMKIKPFAPTVYKNPYQGQQYTLVDGDNSFGDAIFPDYHLFDGPHGLGRDDWFYCARIVSFSQVVNGTPEGDHWFMILYCVDEKACVYKRVGWFEVNRPYSAWKPELLDMCFNVI